jgi:hypothetical protein
MPVYLRKRDPIAYPLYRGLSGLQGRCARVRKMSLPTGFDFPDRLVRGDSYTETELLVLGYIFCVHIPHTTAVSTQNILQ